MRYWFTRCGAVCKIKFERKQIVVIPTYEREQIKALNIFWISGCVLLLRPTHILTHAGHECNSKYNCH